MCVRLVYVPRLSIFGFPSQVTLPQVMVTLGQRRPFKLVTGRQVVPIGEVWGPTNAPRDIDLELLRPQNEPPFLPALREKTVAWREIKRIPLVTGDPQPLHLEIEVPEDAREGSNFYLRIEQEVDGAPTGCYTVVISIV